MTRRAAAGRRRLVVVDQSLSSYHGHHYEYAISVAEAALDADLEPIILAHKTFPKKLRHPTVQIIPWFVQAWIQGPPLLTLLFLWLRGARGWPRQTSRRLRDGVVGLLRAVDRRIVAALRAVQAWTARTGAGAQRIAPWLVAPARIVFSPLGWTLRRLRAPVLRSAWTTRLILIGSARFAERSTVALASSVGALSRLFARPFAPVVGGLARWLGARLTSARGWPTRLERWAFGYVREDRPFGVVVAAAYVACRIVQRSLRDSSRASGYGTPRHFGFRLFQAVDRLELRQGDHLFVHTIGVTELEQLLEALIARGQRPDPLLHVLLRRDCTEPLVVYGGTFGQRAALRRFYQAGLWPDRVVFYTDTEELKAQYDRESPIEFLVAPIPFRHDKLADRRREPGAPVHAVYLGDARTEKGYEFLPVLVGGLYDHYVATGRLRFTIQSNFNVPGGELRQPEAREALEQYPPEQVAVLKELLTPEAYYDLVNSADLVVIPYRPESYTVRSSGVMTEALAAGKVVLVRRGTWMANQLDPTRGRDFDEMGEAIAAARELLEDFDAFEDAAQRFKQVWRDRHSPAALVATLLGGHARVANLPAARRARALAQRPLVLVVAVLEFHLQRGGASQVTALELDYLRRRGYRVACAFTSTDLIASDDHWRAREERGHKQLADLDVSYAWILRHGWRWRGFVRHVRAAADAIRLRSSIGHELFVSETHDVPGALAAAAKGGAVDAALANYVFALPVTRKTGLAPDRIVCVMHDIQSRQHALARGAAVDADDLTRELAELATAGHLSAINQEEAKEAAAALGRREVAYWPPALPVKPVEVAELAGCVRTVDVFRAAGVSPGAMKRPDQFDTLLLRAAQAETLDLLYVSTWHPPNVRSFEWFFDEVFEPVLAPLGVNLTVVGNIEHALKEKHRAHPRLLITGMVDSVRPLYAAAKMVVLPVREGAGTSIKTIEALMLGKPIVATALALRGMGLDPAEVPVFDDRRAFARRVVQLWRDPQLRREARAAGFAAIQRTNGQARHDAAMDRSMGEVLGGRAARPSAAAPAPALPPFVEWSPCLAAVNSLMLQRNIPSWRGMHDPARVERLAETTPADVFGGLYTAVAESFMVGRTAPLLKADPTLARLTDPATRANGVVLSWSAPH